MRRHALSIGIGSALLLFVIGLYLKLYGPIEAQPGSVLLVMHDASTIEVRSKIEFKDADAAFTLPVDAPLKFESLVTLDEKDSTVSILLTAEIMLAVNDGDLISVTFDNTQGDLYFEGGADVHPIYRRFGSMLSEQLTRAFLQAPFIPSNMPTEEEMRRLVPPAVLLKKEFDRRRLNVSDITLRAKVLKRESRSGDRV